MFGQVTPQMLLFTMFLHARVRFCCYLQCFEQLDQQMLIFTVFRTRKCVFAVICNVFEGPLCGEEGDYGRSQEKHFLIKYLMQNRSRGDGLNCLYPAGLTPS